MSRLTSLTVAVAATLCACNGDAPASVDLDAAPITQTAPELPADLDLATVMQRARVAFRVKSDAFTGRGGSYEATVTRTASISLLPSEGPDDDGSPTPLTLTTSWIGGAVAAPAVQRDDTLGHLEITREGSVEVLENTDAGLHQSWHFDRRPTAGDLVVRVRIDGMQHLATTPTGVHLGAAEQAVGFSYGHGTWIGADGAASPVPARFEDGHIVLTVPGDVVARTSYPAVLDPVVGPEFGIDDPIIGEHTDQRHPKVAYDGTNFMMVWEDWRSRTHFDVYGTRVARDGTVLDPHGIPIAVAHGHQQGADIVFDGTSYLVVWVDKDLGAPPITRAVQVGVDGGVRGSAVQVNTAPWGSEASVIFDGANYLITYRHETNLMAARLRPDLSRLSAADTVLTTATRSGATLAHNGSGFIVVFSGDLGWEFLRLDANAAPIDATPRLLNDSSAALGNFGMASDGTDYFVTWQDNREGATRIYGTLVRSGDGTVVEPLGVRVGPATTTQGSPRVFYDGTEYVLVYRNNTGAADSDLFLTHITRAGLVRDPAGVEMAHEIVERVSPIDIVWTGTDIFVGWYNRTDWYLRAGWFDTTGASTGAPIAPGGSQEHESNLDLAWGGTVFLATWQEGHRDEAKRVFAARVTLEGDVLDPIALPVGTGWDPGVEWGGNSFLIAWGDGYLTRGARVTPAGRVLDPEGFLISNEPGTVADAAIAFNGTVFYVVWRNNFSSGIHTFGSRVTPSGAVLDPSSRRISQGSTAAYNASIASDGDGFLVTYQQASRSYGERITGDGVLLDDPALRFNGGALPSAAFGGGVYLITTTSGSASSRNVSVERLTPAGVSLDPTPTLISDTPSRLPRAVGFGGTNFLVVLEDTALDSSHDLHGVRISQTGALLDPLNGFPISTDPHYEGAPVVTSPGGDRFLVGYPQVETLPGDGGHRNRLRWIDRLPRCEADADCATGHCVDAVCCDTACGGGELDCMACSTMAGGTLDGTCGPLDVQYASTLECRGDSGPCDLGAFCTPTATSCPGNTYASGVECRAAAGACDVAETCDGSGPACPGDAVDTGTECRPSSGPCDIAESCDGSGVLCPTDAFDSATECRAASGDCDVAEVCDGSGAACPSDGFDMGTECRAAVGACDVAESCDGSSADCPLDGFDMGTECRASAGPCDVAESCDGSGAACPADGFDGSSLCRTTAGPCDVLEVCDGSGAACPTDVLLSGTECRPADGVCDVADACDGVSPACPADAHAPDGTLCLDELACDGAEVCSVGVCVPGSAVECDDGDACTADSCAEPAGACMFSPIAECCALDNDCEDGDLCTDDTCDGDTGRCVHDVVEQCCSGDADCNDGRGCTVDVCDPRTARCENTRMDGPCCILDEDCDDGDPCTRETCFPSTGMCDFERVAECCLVDDDCADDDECTNDICDTEATRCAHPPIPMCEAAVPDTGPDVPRGRRGGGCGCSLPGRGSPSDAFWLALGMFAIITRRLRRRL